MADKNSDQEKTEEPTPQKLKKAREEGNVSISREVSSVVLMGVAVIVFISSGGYMYNRLEALFETFLLESGTALDDPDHAIETIELAFWFGFEMMMPILGVIFVTAFLVNVAQTGGAISVKAIQPKGSKLNPISGIKKIFSMKGFVELIKGFLKLGIVTIVIWFTIRNDIDQFVAYAVKPLGHNLEEAGSYILMFVTRILSALFILSIVDAVYQRFQHRKDLRMTKQEVKDEYKQSEGDPHLKSKRRSMGLSFRQKKRLDHAVLSSDVVVTNPTHYAVALRYDPEINDAPIVMAKGQRLKALRIKELARHYDIPMVENRPVAQALFATAEVDERIPADLFRAVAEILAYVYKLKKQHNV
ncbi:MAG: flagellar biosynthesis protein FlhB [Balneolaceae bacterium]